jgi:hypothetical protein
MQLTEEELTLIEEYAGLFLTWHDIATLLKKRPAEFKAAFDDKNSELFQAYSRGQVTSKLNLRRPVIKMAEHGSPQAEILAQKFIEEQQMAELDG